MTNKLKWGFDFTHFGSADNFRNLLRRHKLLSGYKPFHPIPEYKTYRRFSWSNSKVLLVTLNNPLTGEYGDKGKREKDYGYASYIGIEGEKDAVLSIVKDIKRTTKDIKDESPRRRSFI